MSNTSPDLTKTAQENINCLIKANETATKGFAELNKYILGLVGKYMEGNAAATKRLASAKSPVEFAQAQFQLAQDSLNTLMTESKKISELAAAIAKDASQPLSETFKLNMAAATKAIDVTKRTS
jgi:phasin family protein